MVIWGPCPAHNFELKCPGCKGGLHSKELYNRVCLVLDICSFYYLAVKLYGCNKCSGTFIAYDHRIMEQLPFFLHTNFPVVLTYKYAWDDTEAW